MDNRTTAMTGHQPHPGVPLDAMGEEAPALDIAELAKAIGAGLVEVVDPYDFKAMQDALRRALEHDGVSVVVARRECALLTVSRKRRAGEPIRPFRVDPEKCTHCLSCINTYACPAFVDRGDVVEIDPALCFGCGSCVQVCPFGAIVPSEGAKPWLGGE